MEFAQEPLKEGIILLIIIIAALVIHYILTRLLAKFLQKNHDSEKIALQAFLETITTPIKAILWTYVGCLIIERGLSILKLAENKESLNQLRFFIILFISSWFALRFKNRFIHLVSRNKEKHSINSEKAKLDIISKLITLLIIIFTTLFTLEALGFNAQTLATIGGLSGFSIGFAGKDVIANFFGGLMLYITRPFVVGEKIRSEEKKIEGTVEMISWYYTVIKGKDKQPIYIPNSLFSSLYITNLTRISHGFIEEKIPISYKDIHSIESISKKIKQYLNSLNVVDTKEPIYVYFDKFTPTSLELTFSLLTTYTNKEDITTLKQTLLIHMQQILKSEGASLAHEEPHQTITIDAPIIVKTST